MAILDARARITQTVLSWPGITAEPHRFGGTEYRLGGREIGHIHGDWLVDIPFPKKVRDEVVASGRAEPHHVLPESGWISLYLRADSDIHTAIDLLKRSYDLAVAQQEKRNASHQAGLP